MEWQQPGESTRDGKADMTYAQWERLYVLTTRLQAMRDISSIARIGLDKDLKRIAKIADRSIDRLYAEMERLQKKVNPAPA